MQACSLLANCTRDAGCLSLLHAMMQPQLATDLQWGSGVHTWPSWTAQEERPAWEGPVGKVEVQAPQPLRILMYPWSNTPCLTCK
jgi:hypothetical protein